MTHTPIGAAARTGAPDARSFADRVVAWHRIHGRHDLPWQHPASPYRVWVSEIMLQQTQVATVVPYFERFVARFADVRALAQASLDDVLHLWSGLGYYARARNLHAAARRVCEAHGGELPESFDALRALPGIGRSTAGAILALARSERHAILDGNVRRVLARHRGIDGWPGSPRVERALWDAAERATPRTDVAAYTQAMMDLGATLCVRARPACARCPIAEDCIARREGRQHALPAPRPRRPVPVRSARMLIAIDGDGAVLLEQRPASGVWGGLWSFPELADGDDPQEWLRRRIGCAARGCETWTTFRHTFTHFHLDIVPLVVRVDATPARVMEGASLLWYNERQPPAIGLAAPVRSLIARLEGTR
jgi:A/G-specific adenine glycosylase